MSVEDLPSIVKRKIGRPVVFLLYSRSCMWCVMSLGHLRGIANDYGDLIDYAVYSLDQEENHENFVSMAEEYADVFDPVRVSTPDRTLPYLRKALTALGFREEAEKPSVPTFALFDRRGHLVVQGDNAFELVELNDALAQLFPEVEAPRVDFTAAGSWFDTQVEHRISTIVRNDEARGGWLSKEQEADIRAGYERARLKLLQDHVIDREGNLLKSKTEAYRALSE